MANLVWSDHLVNGEHKRGGGEVECYDQHKRAGHLEGILPDEKFIAVRLPSPEICLSDADITFTLRQNKYFK